MSDVRRLRPHILVIAAGLALAAAASAAPDSDLDAFMARVLERRDENWRKLQQYILDERESAELIGPGNARLFGLVREYTWYIRDDVFVRSPVRFNGVALSEDERRRYEDQWIARERERGQRDRERAAAQAAASGSSREADADTLMRLAREPQFVSAAYFLRFKFEPGRYAFAGPDTHEGGRVLKIEYYPTRLYGSDDKNASAEDDEEKQTEKRLDRQFNKIALVTLWVEPESHQIVKYEFDNVGFDFLPGRSLVRVDEMRASMTMGQPFRGVWLPRRIEGRGSATLANGSYEVLYAIDYHDYREAAVKARVR